MRYLKIFFGIVSILVLVPLVVAFFSKDEYFVKRSIEINQPVEIVFNYVKEIKNQENYSSWSEKDPNMQKSYQGKDGTIGFVYSWQSDNNNVGAGEQEITNILENNRIDFDLRFTKPLKTNDKAYLKTEAIEDSLTKVTWGYEAKLPYPFNFYMFLIDFEKMIGDEFEKGLLKLKNILEEK